MNTRMISSATVLLLAAGAAIAQPTVTVLPGSPNPLVMPLDIADNGSVIFGYESETRGWMWDRASGFITSMALNAPAALSGDGSKFVSEYHFPATNVFGYLNTPQINDWPVLTNTFATPPAEWRGCDDDVANVQDISGNGRFVAALVWGDPSCPNPASNGSCCKTTPAIYDTANMTWQLLQKQNAAESTKLSRLNGDGTVGIGWDNNSTRRGCVWNNGVQTLLSVGAVGVGEGYAVSENGRWLAGTKTPTNTRAMWRWKNGSAATAAQDLGLVPTTINGGNAVYISGITNNGKTIYGFRGFGIDRDAFIWREGHGYQKLYDYLLQIGVLNGSEPFFRILTCGGVSPTGRYLGAQGKDFGGTHFPLYIDLGPQACSGADLGGQGGVPVPDYQLDNNDFVVFIDMFFNGNPSADVGVQGGVAGQDAIFDNNDFIVFIDMFFAGC